MLDEISITIYSVLLLLKIIGIYWILLEKKEISYYQWIRCRFLGLRYNDPRVEVQESSGPGTRKLGLRYKIRVEVQRYSRVEVQRLRVWDMASVGLEYNSVSGAVFRGGERVKFKSRRYLR